MLLYGCLVPHLRSSLTHLQGLALGILATAGIAGPIGWVVGGLVEALFAILPGLFEEPKGRPHVDNTTEIIQWVMFGDADHT